MADHQTDTIIRLNDSTPTYGNCIQLIETKANISIHIQSIYTILLSTEFMYILKIDILIIIVSIYPHHIIFNTSILVKILQNTLLIRNMLYVE